MTAMKRILLILLTLAMLMSLVPTAFAADGEVTKERVYVLQRANTSGGSEPNMQYESAYPIDYYWDGVFSGWPFPAIYTKLSPNG